MPLNKDEWLGGGLNPGNTGGGVSHPVGPIGQGRVVLGSSSAATPAGQQTQARKIARALAQQRTNRRTNYRLFWD